MKYTDHVIIRNQVFRWEEKAPFVPSGKSVLGAIEYDANSGTIKCHECGDLVRHIGPHLKTHKLPGFEYKRRHGIAASSALCSPQLRASYVRVAITSGTGSRIKGASPLQRFRMGSTPIFRSPKQFSELRNLRNTCRAQLLNRIRVIAEEIGETPGTKHVSSGMQTAAVQEFGSWKEFMREAGMEALEGGRKTIPTIILTELIRDFFVLNKRLPARNDFSSGSLPSQSIVIRAFGSMQEAFHQAGLSGEYEKVKGGPGRYDRRRKAEEAA